MREWLSRLSGKYYVAAGCLAVIVLGFADLVTGNELRLSVFYLAPVFLVTWKTGIRAGIALSAAAATVEAVTDVMGGLSYSSPLVFYWNAAIEGLSFLVVALITSVLKRAYEREKSLARTDSLTGIANRQAFLDVVEREIERSRRYHHPLTIAYMDCDNFKAVNDSFGHQTGDRALRVVAGTIVKNVRAADTAARLGGDEFALFLPETGAASAKEALDKIRAVLLEAMEKNRWPITFSIGVATFVNPPASADEMLSRADALMYSVKNESKDMIQCAEY